MSEPNDIFHWQLNGFLALCGTIVSKGGNGWFAGWRSKVTCPECKQKLLAVSHMSEPEQIVHLLAELRAERDRLQDLLAGVVKEFDYDLSILDAPCPALPHMVRDTIANSKRFYDEWVKAQADRDRLRQLVEELAQALDRIIDTGADEPHIADGHVAGEFSYGDLRAALKALAKNNETQTNLPQDGQTTGDVNWCVMACPNSPCNNTLCQPC